MTGEPSRAFAVVPSTSMLDGERAAVPEGLNIHLAARCAALAARLLLHGDSHSVSTRTELSVDGTGSCAALHDCHAASGPIRPRARPGILV